ncbi:unnamed protein product [Lactuca virosa]|uniref:Uncharacterized protein n=1 Tax=Lactuca virosa TaxID=75947 RepID=A0AAU9PIA4_9ASTR|nr:unnamed protein product [Lactuca virosa]
MNHWGCRSKIPVGYARMFFIFGLFCYQCRGPSIPTTSDLSFVTLTLSPESAPVNHAGLTQHFDDNNDSE